MKYNQMRSSPIKFDRVGRGPPIVLLHGALSDTRIWQHLISSLLDRFTLISYNQIFFREGDDLSVDIEGHLDQLVEVLDRSDSREVTLFAWSWGASIAMLAAMRIPRRVKRLILYEPGGPPLTQLLRNSDETSAHPTFLQYEPTIRAEDEAEAAKALIEGLYDLGEGNYDRAGLSDQEKSIHRDNASHLRAINSIEFEFDTQMINSIKQPTVIMTGGLTKNARLMHIAELCCRLMPHAQLSIIDGARHSGPFTHSREIASAVDVFMNAE